MKKPKKPTASSLTPNTILPVRKNSSVDSSSSSSDSSIAKVLNSKSKSSSDSSIAKALKCKGSVDSSSDFSIAKGLNSKSKGVKKTAKVVPQGIVVDAAETLSSVVQVPVPIKRCDWITPNSGEFLLPRSQFMCHNFVLQLLNFECEFRHRIFEVF